MDNSSETSRSSFSNMGSQSSKYQGIIEKSFFKKTRNEVFFLFSYLYSVAPNFYWLHTIFSIYRIWQLIAPAFCYGFINLWKGNPTFQQIINILVLPVYLIPPSKREGALLYVLVIFIVLMVTLIFIILGVGRSFHANAKLPKSMPSIIVFFFGSIGFIIEFLGAIYSGELIGHIISDTIPFSLPVCCIMLVLTLVLFLAYAYFYCDVISISLTFQPNSLQTVTNKSQTGIFLITNLIAFFLGIASATTRLVTRIFTIISMVLYGCGFFFVFLDGGLTNFVQTICICASLASGFLGLAIIIVFLFSQTTISEVYLIIYVVFWLIAAIVSSFVINHIKKKHLEVLDRIMDDESEFQHLVKSPAKYARVLVTGFEQSHPQCLNWNFCRLATVQWPNSIISWYLYAKFTAIYPEETMQLICIGKSMKQHKLKGGFVRQTIDQMASLIRQREPNLSRLLQNKLGSINKDVQSTKHKLRNVWDMIIQSNIGEMEIAISKTYTSIEKNEAEFSHLLRQYPNNRFVFRAYSRFLVEVQADYKKYEVWEQSTKLLARGMECNEDQAHEHGLHTYPLLPTYLKTTSSSNSKMVMESFEDVSTNNELTFHDSMETSMDNFFTIEDMIDDIRIPSIKKTICVRLFLLFVCVICTIVAGILFDNFYLRQLTEPLEFVYTLSYMRSMIFHLTGYSIQTVLDKMPDKVHRTFKDLDNLIYLGSTTKTHEQLLHLVKEASSLSNDIVKIQNFQKGDPLMDKARSLIFT
ncbi:hypothetical protein TRFO_01409 [Tritrichomonas foetus]|uniref:Uncharacterized protein n=1 Tax=Tritrichomonas foetus TaxID=1144522 RepID=A0A1J4K6Y3_9EUKA|nr:hypothetical protein TRFO_01409 [Tritrichomonas foetus]|eukprot:OHT07233.1 hypothetical protein TRFO_01409 [Tritrichomonas foetus]